MVLNNHFVYKRVLRISIKRGTKTDQHANDSNATTFLCIHIGMAWFSPDLKNAFQSGVSNKL
eukprot:6474577-Amphidinium_carterae.2